MCPGPNACNKHLPVKKNSKEGLGDSGEPERREVETSEKS
jgi:hypothetical protein